MKTISKKVKSDSPAMTKTAIITNLVIQGSSAQVGIGYVYTDENGKVFNSPEVKPTVLQVNSQDPKQADLFDSILSALEPVLLPVIADNTEAE